MFFIEPIGSLFIVGLLIVNKYFWFSAGVGRTGTIICLFNLLLTYCKFLPDLRKDLNENL